MLYFGMGPEEILYCITFIFSIVCSCTLNTGIVDPFTLAIAKALPSIFSWTLCAALCVVLPATYVWTNDSTWFMWRRIIRTKFQIGGRTSRTWWFFLFPLPFLLFLLLPIFLCSLYFTSWQLYNKQVTLITKHFTLVIRHWTVSLVCQSQILLDFCNTVSRPRAQSFFISSVPNSTVY